MPFPFFSDPPTVALLQWLARGSLKQNLPRAIRLWAWLQFLYGEEGARAGLPQPFTYTDWRDAFFTSSHPTGEAIPELHDPTCRCARSAADWLFNGVTGISQVIWQKSLKQHDSHPDNLKIILKSRSFGITRRSLYEDLQILCKLGWVKRKSQEYYRLEEFPTGAHPPGSGNIVIVHPDLAAIANTLSHLINGYQRFFVHVEYVVPKEATDRVDDWQVLLRQIWEQSPVPPVQLTFYSAKLDAICTTVVYPVCVYYAQRGPYLCAWGQVPGSDNTGMDWRNYRLDRIQHIQPLSWDAPNIPQLLRQAYQRKKLPSPDEIQERMGEAWGFDFYQPVDTLLLRFDWDFAKRYIKTSLRHETFSAASHNKAKALIRAKTNPTICQKLLEILQERSPHDAYYTAQYRRHDPNILLRLRAWRPHLEVLLPWDLRQQFAAEVKQEYQFYDDVELCSNSSST